MPMIVNGYIIMCRKVGIQLKFSDSKKLVESTILCA